MAINRYVSKTGSNISPYLTWETAAATIQDALDVALSDDTVWVGNGTYFEAVDVRGYITLRSGTGIPTDVVIDGELVERTVSVVQMASATCWLIGVTVANGKRTGTGSGFAGGGVSNGTVSNCIISGNTNTANEGGGAGNCTLYNCLLIGNTNTGGSRGGGAGYCTLYNCTIVKNTASTNGGVYGCTLYNCISYLNSSIDINNTFYYSCGIGYIVNNCINATTSPPLFINNTDYHLQEISPCIDTGLNYDWMTDPNDFRSKDLDGNPRSHNNVVDMGIYENQFSDFSSSSSSSSLSSSSISSSSISSSSISSSSISSSSISSISSSSYSSISSSSTEHHLNPPYNLTFIADAFTRKIIISWEWDNPGHVITEPTGFTIDRKIGANSWESLSSSIAPEDRSYEDILSEENAALVFVYDNLLSYRIRAFVLD